MLSGYQNRREAGEILAEDLQELENSNGIVLALPRGGVPVGAEIAARLKLPLEVILSRKLGAPGNPEAAIGAVAEGGSVYLDPFYHYYKLSQDYLEQATANQEAEIARRIELFRQGRTLDKLGLAGRVVIVVDDGIATGDTLKAALTAIQGQQPARIIIAAPVAPPDEVGNLQGRGYEVVCPLQPKDMVAVGYWYKDFRPVSDEEVLEILRHQTPMYRA